MLSDSCELPVQISLLGSSREQREKVSPNELLMQTLHSAYVKHLEKKNVAIVYVTNDRKIEDKFFMLFPHALAETADEETEKDGAAGGPSWEELGLGRAERSWAGTS